MDFVFLGFMAAMAVAGLVVGKLAGKKLGKAEFDERQQLARGKAYKAGFYTLLVGLLAVYLIPIFTEWQPKDTALLPFLVICVGGDGLCLCCRCQRRLPRHPAEPARHAACARHRGGR